MWMTAERAVLNDLFGGQNFGERSHRGGLGGAFLASDDARWITGITLPLGWTSGYGLPGDALA